MDNNKSDFDDFLNEYNILNLSSEDNKVFKTSTIPRITNKKIILPWEKSKKITYSKREYIMRKNSCISLLCLCLKLQKFCQKFYSETTYFKNKLTLKKSRHFIDTASLELKYDTLIIRRYLEEIRIKCTTSPITPKVTYKSGFADYFDIGIRTEIYIYLCYIYVIIDFMKIAENDIKISESTILSLSLNTILDGEILMYLQIKDLVKLNILISNTDITFIFLTHDLSINEFLEKLNSEYEYSLLEKIFINEMKIYKILSILSNYIFL